MSVTDESTRQALHRRLESILRNTADAEETAQEAILIFLSSRAAQQSREPIPYLFKIAINLARNLLKRRQRAHVSYDSEAADLRMDALANQQSEDSIAAQLFRHQQLERIVQDLPENLQQVVLMHFGQGLPLPEIAELLKLSPATVKTYLARARAHAKRMQWD